MRYTNPRLLPTLLTWDACVVNDSFIHCVIFWLLQISITGQICSFLWTRKGKKAFSFRGASLPWPLPGALPPGTPLGLRPQTPFIGSRTALAMEFKLCAVLNWSLKKPWGVLPFLCFYWNTHADYRLTGNAIIIIRDVYLQHDRDDGGLHG